MSLEKPVLKMHDDGKDKWQSFEARLGLDSHWGMAEIIGYGATPEEAIEELKAKVKLHIKNLQDIDWEQEPVPVDWKGDPIDAV